MSLRIYGNRPLKTLPGLATRPTPSRVREALFNIWQGRVAGCRWLDLCSGSGSMGAEALCRGAAAVVGIEQSSRACGVIRENWTRLATSDQSVTLLRGDVVQRLSSLAGQQFDRIYFDPPYASGLYEPVIGAIAHHRLLASGGELAMEHSPDRWAQADLAHWQAQVPSLDVCRQKTYGNTALTFWHRAIAPSSSPAETTEWESPDASPDQSS
ncbi:MAG: 16S rRNA (guanine(966)-N(2))-methyltransferase RsmD [Kaiparowitsia implicata GSE-PSE-MK54-09C]|jgi:16S rRNA (guanine(966)-N(2))-methyltransferase RsmD|nr:16S rRNA (guanine(966)-N(2))-methyltransferase RsmD [Kaiparowitsia implicata GSE-PSE-MK54-09C]